MVYYSGQNLLAYFVYTGEVRGITKFLGRVVIEGNLFWFLKVFNISKIIDFIIFILKLDM